ncbi:hypothetical protein IAT38_004405 [Cryptococcus sp. DSM 104549]
MSHRSTRQKPSPSPSPSRPPETQVEVLYNTAVQSFVRRDHVKTQATLSRLLDLLGKKRGSPSRVWYELDTHREPKGDDTGIDSTNDDWMVKTLKLLISSTASLFTDPPHKTSALPATLIPLLPPASPKDILSHLQARCVAYYYPSPPSPALLPPQLISTLILASLKLRPLTPCLDFAHQVTETWLADLPDAFILAISPSAATAGSARKRSKGDAVERKLVESAREGYLKVVELFVGEVLSREGEWEMARGFLEGESVMGSKRKEALYRHLRTIQSKPTNPTPSPSSSLILPSDTEAQLGPPPGGKKSPRPRTGSTSSASSSSSEATARPSQVQRGLTMADKGKARDTGSELAGTPTTEDTLKLPVAGERANTTGASSSPKRFLEKRSTGGNPINRPSSPLVSWLTTTLHLPHPLAARISAFASSPYVLAAPIPLVILLTLFRLRRTRALQSRDRRAATAGASTQLSNVQARLNLVRDRQRGWLEWIWWYVRWWLSKFAGVWKLGTTITYV